MPVKPTPEQMLFADDEEDFEVLKDKTVGTYKTVGTWRWGTVQERVVRRISDNTYWLTSYRRSNDGETNELREGIADIEQVEPVTKTITVTKYVAKQG